MSQRMECLEGNENFAEQNLRFVRNEMEDNINQLLSGTGTDPQLNVPESILVQPKPGFCVKSFKVNSNDEKFFINVCQAPEVPAPEDISDEKLLEVFKSPTPGSYRVPMSVSDPRNTKDRAGNIVEACDIAINPKFFNKIKNSHLFNNFFMQIIFEALSEKYNIQIALEKTKILHNRKFMGALVPHRVRKEAAMPACPAAAQNKLVQEIGQQELQELQKKGFEARDDHSIKIKSECENFWTYPKEPEYKLCAKIQDDIVVEIHVELFLPKCISSGEFNVDIGEDRIYVEFIKRQYVFDKYVDYRLNQERAQGIFDKTTKMLLIRIPVHN